MIVDQMSPKIDHCSKKNSLLCLLGLVFSLCLLFLVEVQLKTVVVLYVI